MSDKKKVDWVKYILITLFVVYLGLYTLNETGYYSGSNRRKVEFTERQILEFEKDIEEGKPVDINDYLEGQIKDYSNTTSRIGYAISSNVEAFLSKGLKDFIQGVAKFFS